MMQRIGILTNDRIVHSFKTALAVFIGFFITKLIHVPIDQWIIITIIVVMCAQMNVGSMLQKSYMRFLGSLVGSLVAAATLTFFGLNIIAIACVITLSAFIFSYIATSKKSFNEAGTLGAVTVVIILIGQNPTIQTAAGRFLEISVGILIAALISQFILPIHARRNLRKNQIRTLHHLENLYNAIFLSSKNNDKTIIPIIDETIVKSLIDQRKLAIDASRELFKRTYNISHFKESLWCEKEILRSILFMHHAYSFSPNLKNLFSSMKAVKNFHQTVSSSLNQIANCLEKNTMNITLPNWESLRDAITAAIKILPNEEIIYANGFLFCAGILTKRIEALGELVKEI